MEKPIMSRRKIVIIDDERLAIRRLEILLEQIPRVELVGTAQNVRGGLRLIEREQPDIALVDIAMIGKSGIDLVDMLPSQPRPVIIFVTAFDSHAVKAFDREAIDYVLKPVKAERLSKAIERALRVVDERDLTRDLQHARALMRQAPGTLELPSKYAAELWAHRYGELVRVALANVEWMEAEKDYVRLHTKTDSYLIRCTMQKLESLLDPKTFARIHRSTIVKIASVTAVRRRATGLLVARLEGGREINVGRHYFKSFETISQKLHAAGMDETSG
jgi:DNA-binding LytR/AlgR family response regulator